MSAFRIGGSNGSFCLVRAGISARNVRVNRRQFIRSTAFIAGAGTVGLNPLAHAAAPGVAWPIGSLNRPWAIDKKGWSYDTALDGIKAAGYRLTGLLTRTPNEAFIGADATPEDLAKLKDRIAARGLAVNMAALRLKGGLDLQEEAADGRKQIDNARTLGLQFVMTFDSAKSDTDEKFLALMRQLAAYAQDRGVKLVMKPHGGSAGGITRCLEKVNHPNFKIWYDAGNIIFYTGKDPVEEIKAIASEVTGVIAKDCDKQKGSVAINLGDGAVNFPSIYAHLKKSGFNGPTLLECSAPGATPEAVTANARKCREYWRRFSPASERVTAHSATTVRRRFVNWQQLL